MSSDLGDFSVEVSWLRARDGLKWKSAGPGVLAAWVADMDFPAPPVVRAALAALAADGDLGYPEWLHDAPVRDEFARRMACRYGWSPDPALVRDFTDIIQAVQAVLYVATEPGDGVIMHVPAYPPFLGTLAGMNRRLIPLPIERTAGGWAVDPQRLARAAAVEGARALILVHPHNPTGRSFTRPELELIADAAQAHDLVVISDEVHADLTYPPHVHIPFASISAAAAERTVTLTSATKAFNLAGIRYAVAHVGSARVRAAFAAMPPLIFGAPNVPGVTATLSAWRDGSPWLAAVLGVLDANRRILLDALTPLGVGLTAPDATYLAWLDCRDLGLPGDPAEFFLDRAKVMLSPGPRFGGIPPEQGSRGVPAAGERQGGSSLEFGGPAPAAELPGGAGGEGFVRLNFATSPMVLTEICERMAAALAAR
jgi:cystathionine beta-lyase